MRLNNCERYIGLVVVILVSNFFEISFAEQSKYTNDERTAIDNLRPLIASYLIPDFMKTDDYHLRLLKVAKFDLNTALENVKRTSKWRKDNNIDNILNEDLSVHMHNLTISVEGVDKEGSPVIAMQFGKWDLRKHAWSGNPEFRRLPVKVYSQALEKGEHQIYKIQKTNVSAAIFLNDIDGYSIARHGCLQCLSISAEIVRITSIHYPNILKKIVAINAPRIFSQILELINEIAPQLTKIISVYGREKGEWERHILKHISADQIPTNFGGTRNN